MSDFRGYDLSFAPYSLIVERRPADQTVLVHLWKYRGNDTEECFPSMKTLARICGMREPAVRSALIRLEKDGLVKVVHKQHKDKSFGVNHYQLPYPNEHLRRGYHEKHGTYYENHVLTNTNITNTVSNTSKDVLSPVKSTAQLEEPFRESEIEEVVRKWNEIASRNDFRKVRAPTSALASKVKARFRDCKDPIFWQEFWEALSNSPYLRKHPWFKFAWCFKSFENIEKVHDQAYKGWDPNKKREASQKDRIDAILKDNSGETIHKLAREGGWI